MDTIEQFKTKLKEIADFAFGNGAVFLDNLKTMKIDISTLDLKKEFLIACNDGFKKAQILLIEEIKNYQNILRKESENLKTFRLAKDNESHGKSQTIINVINQRLNSLMHIGDGIAWHLLKGEIHVMRRYYLQEKTTKFLDSSNIEHAIKTAEEINKEPLNFALITDITNSIQIGDLLISEEGIVKEVELKEGIINDKIIKVF
ncbi:hypothetical protein [Chryseobacterium sp.]|uniref:hypothetical protein n=1 Tax=Chryseobacterium sp. TaxID=1871047 RepID=UPI002896417B|nr:hypothetical protein [Chryseobacterium sp.]